MKKRIVSMVLVLCLLVTTLPFQVLATSNQSKQANSMQNPFEDVNENDWFYESVMYAVENGLFDGIGGKKFSPKEPMTRGMFVTVLGRIAQINTADYKGKEYSDVPIRSSYAPYVKWAKEKGITMGVGDGRFDPDGSLTREQMATMTVRFFDVYQFEYPKSSVVGEPADLDSISEYAKEAVLKLWRSGLITGDDKGYFNPRSKATRAEAATFSGRTDRLVISFLAKQNRPPIVISGSVDDSENEDDDEVVVKTHAITFMEGNNRMGQVVAQEGKPLDKLPGNEITAKDGYIFIGWYTDPEFSNPFYAQDPVMTDLTVYAKYEELIKEQLTLSSFALTDQNPDLSFIIQRIDSGAVDVHNGILLTVIDGSDPVALSIIDQGDGTYIVSAVGGFKEGASYQLTLANGYIFKEKLESIRTASFTIKKEEVDNLTLNNEIIFIQDTEEMYYTIGTAQPVPVLYAAILNSQTSEALTGTFSYIEASSLKSGDVLCIFEIVDPRQRDYSKFDYKDDAEAYVEVVSVNGLTVTFTSLDESDAEKVVFIPDTIPFSVVELPTQETGMVESTAVDNDARQEMELNSDPEIEPGDFVVFYQGAFADVTEETQVYYGIVTSVSGINVSYRQTTREEIEKSMDTFIQQTQDADQLLEDVDTDLLVGQIQQQVLESGFAQEAAEYLALMVTQTDGFQSLSGLKEFSMRDQNGNILTADELMLMGIGANIELSDDVNVKVRLGKSSKYFTDGVGLELGISAEFTVDVGDGGELKIDLSATFVEELAVDITASAYAKIKWIFIVPKFKKLVFSTAVDIKNYAGVSVDVKVYTVEKEEESIWEKLKGINNGSFKEVFDQIEDVKNKIDQAKDTVEQIARYKDDLKKLWQAVPSDITNEEEYEGMLDTLGELNVTQELMGMLNLTNEDELDAGVRNLMERYSEMLENESDWIEIVNKKVFEQEMHIKIFAIGISASFVIKGNVNIALGANMEYVIGKRYSFWFDIISKTSGSSEMDLLDEKFAFQFYVMGELGLRMGVQAEICVGIISTKIGSIGVTAEFGPYVKMWGYFVYEYTKLRPANTSTWKYDERMLGALYLEFGLYLEITFKATLFGKTMYQPTLLDKEWPLLTAGTRLNVYGFAYEIEEDESLLVKDQDSNSQNGIAMVLPESYRLMEYMDLVEGDTAQSIYDHGKFHYTLSNRHFTFDEQTGLITVTVPKDTQYMECDLILTWKMDKLAFSSYDISITIPLVWTNLSEDELNQRFTAAVRVGNPNDGYTTVWSQRVVKNAPFDLPTEEKIRELLSVSQYEAGIMGNLKYASISGYQDQALTGLTILKDTVYYFDVTPRTYTITVVDVEKADGTKENRQYTAKFGEAFDLSDLYQSGSDDDITKTYTSFLKIVAKDASNKEIIRDFNQPISEGFAVEMLSGATYTATYADHSATVIFTFEGVDIDPIEVKMKKGDVPTMEAFINLVSAKNAMIKGIDPILAPVTGVTTYTVVCEVLQVPIVERTITYQTNGGSEILQLKAPEGSIITQPEAPVRAGYVFDGWYSDDLLQQAFTFTVMPNSDTTLYAGWKGVEVTITFDGNEGDLGLDVPDTSVVIYGDPYGILPVPVRTGFAFGGWYTDRTQGDLVTAETVVNKTQQHTLYAHWTNKAMINPDIISFVPDQNHDYDTNSHSVVFTTGDSEIEAESFTVVYKRQNLDNNWTNEAVNAGLYDVKITRGEDEAYQSFEKTFTGVMTIHKIDRTISAIPTGSSYKANILVDLLPEGSYLGDGVVEYAASTTQTAPVTGWQTSRAIMNLSAGNYYLFVRVNEGENYLVTPSSVSNDTIFVEGIAENSLEYFLGMTIATSNIDKAGTDSIIKGQYIYLDGSASAITHFDNGGNDFEKGDVDSYLVLAPLHDPWMISQVFIFYERKGSSSGWHCKSVTPYAVRAKVGDIAWEVQKHTGDVLSVNQWFGAEDHDADRVQANGNVTGMKRNISSVGNFVEIPESMILTSSDTTYTFTYDGMVIDQYAIQNVNDVSTPYNAYDHGDAPLLAIYADDAIYNTALSYTINSMTVDKAALYAAMKANNDTEVMITVTLQFPTRSTTPETATYTKTILVTLGD